MDDILMRWVIKDISTSDDVDLHKFTNLKTDEEKLNHAIKYLSNNEKSLEIYQQTKSANKANEYIEMGNKKCIQSNSWQDILGIYTEAVIYSPCDSDELARAYGCRSAALCDIGLYNDCLLDIERAINIGYPDELKAKLYLRKAKCYLALHKIISPQVIECVCETYKWLEKMTNANKHYMINVLNRLYMNSTKHKLFNKIDSSELLPCTPNDNSKIKGASGAIEIKYSEKFGRHVVATRDIKAGETLLVHKAYASIVHPRLFHKSCWNCLKRVWAGVPCRQCVNVIYCNEVCRDTAWNQHHDIECRVITAMLKAQVISSELLCLRLAIKAYKEAGTFEKLKENIGNIDRINGDAINNGFSDNMFDHTKYASVYTIFRPTIDTAVEFKLALQSSVILYFLAATTEIFGKKIDNFDELLSCKWTIFFGGLIMRHAVALGINHSTVRDADGIGVNPFLTLLNHSCDFMTVSHNYGDINVVVAIQMIQKGEQIFTNYGTNFYHQTTAERRNYLMKLSNFMCECVACMGNWGPNSLLSFPSTGVERWPTAIDIPHSLIDQKYRHTKLYSTANSVEKSLIISNIADKINYLFQKYGKYPTKEIINLKAILHNLYCTIFD